MINHWQEANSSIHHAVLHGGSKADETLVACAAFLYCLYDTAKTHLKVLTVITGEHWFSVLINHWQEAESSLKYGVLHCRSKADETLMAYAAFLSCLYSTAKVYLAEANWQRNDDCQKANPT